MAKLKNQDPLVFISNEDEYMKLCFDITVYWVGSVFEQVDGILDFYQQAMKIIGKDITCYQTETMRGARKIKTDTLDLIPFWLTKAPKRREIYMLYLESCPRVNFPSDKAFAFAAMEYEDGPVGMMRLMLPVNSIQDSAESFIDMSKNLNRKMNFHSGHAGYGLNYNDCGDHAFIAQEQMYRLGRRFPGIDIPDIETTLLVISNGIKRVNWLTFLNQVLVDQLGGLKNLKKELGKKIVVDNVENGIIVQAGAAPNIGDVNVGEKLTLYHKVGSVLAPVRATEHPGFIMKGGIFDDDATEEWLSHFDA